MQLSNPLTPFHPSLTLAPTGRDTVASIGLLMSKTLPFTSSETIKFFRHAISLDEHRSKYNVVLWQPENESICPDPTRPESDIEAVIEMWFVGVHSGTSDFTPSPIEEVRVPTDLFDYAF